EEARKKGQVARARALLPTSALLGAILVLPFIGAQLMLDAMQLFQSFFALAGEPRELSSEELLTFALESGRVLLPTLTILFSGVVVAEVSGGLLQTGFLWSATLLQPDFSRLNPLTGLRRLVSLDAAAEVGKAMLEVVCLGALAVLFFWIDLPSLAILSSL